MNNQSLQDERRSTSSDPNDPGADSGVCLPDESHTMKKSSISSATSDVNSITEAISKKQIIREI
jgi:hypothetical protein